MCDWPGLRCGQRLLGGSLRRLERVCHVRSDGRSDRGTHDGTDCAADASADASTDCRADCRPFGGSNRRPLVDADGGAVRDTNGGPNRLPK